jgi:hypothetical protein
MAKFKNRQARVEVNKLHKILVFKHQFIFLPVILDIEFSQKTNSSSYGKQKLFFTGRYIVPAGIG